MNSQNPWLNIPVEDYEGHMSAQNVMQSKMLSEIFADVMNGISPKSIAFLGCTTGNGFEHLIGKDIEQIVGVDINPEYLSACSKRFAKKLPQLKLICEDLSKVNFPNSTFDLIHAALVFEYVDTDMLLSKISVWLKPGGIISVVLQLPSEASAPVTETPFESIKSLVSFIKLIDPVEFKTLAQKHGLEEITNEIVKLKSGKSFSVIKYMRRAF